MKDSWWEDSDYEIAQIENTDDYVTYLCAKPTEEDFEYAIVVWRYQKPHLKCRFKSGVVLERDWDNPDRG
jgi:hypothetical protein